MLRLFMYAVDEKIGWHRMAVTFLDLPGYSLADDSSINGGCYRLLAFVSTLITLHYDQLL